MKHSGRFTCPALRTGDWHREEGSFNQKPLPCDYLTVKSSHLFQQPLISTAAPVLLAFCFLGWVTKCWVIPTCWGQWSETVKERKKTPAIYNGPTKGQTLESITENQRAEAFFPGLTFCCDVGLFQREESSAEEAEIQFTHWQHH